MDRIRNTGGNSDLHVVRFNFRIIFFMKVYMINIGYLCRLHWFYYYAVLGRILKLSTLFNHGYLQEKKIIST